MTVIFENSGQIADKMVLRQKIISANADFTGFAEMIMVPLTGLEPVRYRYRGILSPSCLPISPQRQNIIIFIVPCHNQFVKSKHGIYVNTQHIIKIIKIKSNLLELEI